jgi:VWFA-related protein
MKKSVFAALVVTFAFAGADLKVGPYAGQAPQEPTPTFRQAVEAVQLSVIVTDKEGNPVSGLTEDDFEILEDGKPRSITTFAAVDIPIERVERAVAAPDVLSNERPPGRLYVIALDLMSATSALRTRAFLRKFIETSLGPNDTAAVILITGGLRESGQEFTSNPRLLLNAIDKFDGGTAPPVPRLREKNFIGDFKSLMQFMSTLRGGRKAVVFVSENIPSQADAYQVVDRGRARFGGLFSEVDTDWLDALSLATRNNIAIYPVDPRGLTTGVTGESEDGSITGSQASLDDRIGLAAVAAVTGGFALTGSNNYTAAFERLVRENSTYYLLAFNSGVEQHDGRYVRLEVHVKRPGLQVQSTEGYVQPRGKQQQQPPRPSTVLAATWDAVASGIATSGLPMRVSAAPFRRGGKDKAATVAITVEVSGSKLNLVEQDGAYRGVLEVVFAVTDAKKKRWPIYRHRAALALKPETYERVSNGAIRVLSQLPLPAGHYQLRASAGGAAVAGSVVYDLDVPDFRDDFSLSGVALTSKQASETFTFSPQGRIDVGLPGPPTTAREFSRDDTLTVFAEGYENRAKPHVVSLTIELRDEAGRVLGSDNIERKSVEKPKDASLYTFEPNLSLEDIQPGRYTLHIDARSSLDKNKPVTRDIPFSVR